MDSIRECVEIQGYGWDIYFWSENALKLWTLKEFQSVFFLFEYESAN